MLQSEECIKMDVPDGWVTDRYAFEGEEWCVVYSSESQSKKLYIENGLVDESVTDNFSFFRNGVVVQVARHLRGGYYELEIIRDGVSLLSGMPHVSKISGVKGKLMVVGYMLFAYLVFTKLAVMLGLA